jgi:hypothetical protein
MARDIAKGSEAKASEAKASVADVRTPDPNLRPRIASPRSASRGRHSPPCNLHHLLHCRPPHLPRRCRLSRKRRPRWKRTATRWCVRQCRCGRATTGSGKSPLFCQGPRYGGDHPPIDASVAACKFRRPRLHQEKRPTGATPPAFFCSCRLPKSGSAADSLA